MWLQALRFFILDDPFTNMLKHQPMSHDSREFTSPKDSYQDLTISKPPYHKKSQSVHCTYIECICNIRWRFTKNYMCVYICFVSMQRSVCTLVTHLKPYNNGCAYHINEISCGRYALAKVAFSTTDPKLLYHYFFQSSIISKPLFTHTPNTYCL